MLRVFISHSGEDRAFVEEHLIPLLKQHGMEAWYSEHSIGGGVPWERGIAQGLESSDVLLVVLSPRSVDSDWVGAEVGWWMDVHGTRKQCVPVLIEDCDWRRLHLKLRLIQLVDLRQLDRDAQRRLVEALSGAWTGGPDGGIAPDDLRPLILQASKDQVDQARKFLQAQGKYKPECYVHRRLDFLFDRFLADPDNSCLVVVDKPGTGKTSLLAHQATQAVGNGLPAVLLASDEFLRWGADCSTFDELVLRAIYAGIRADTDRPPLPATLGALCERLPATPGLPKLLVLLDGLNELHNAARAAEGYEEGGVIGCRALRDFLERFSGAGVKLLVSSRELTWRQFYAQDWPAHEGQTWRPNWSDLYAEGFLGGIGLKELQPVPGSVAGPEAAHAQVTGVPLGDFTEPECSLALGIYQRVNRIRVVPGQKAFEMLCDPFFLGLCFSAWAQRKWDWGGEGWYYVQPAGRERESADLVIPVIDEKDLDWFRLMGDFWRAAAAQVVQNVARQAEDPEARRTEARRAVETIVAKMVETMWRTGNDRTPRDEMADSELKREVIDAMVAEEMLATEQSSEGQSIARFARDRIAGFHIIRSLRERLRLESEEPIREFVDMAQEEELFGSLLRQAVREAGRVSSLAAENLLQLAVWQDRQQPDSLIEVCQCLEELPAEAIERLSDSVLWRYVSWLLPRDVWGPPPADPLNDARQCAENVRRHAGRSDGGPVQTVLELPDDLGVHISSTALDLAARLSEITAGQPGLAGAMRRMILHALECIEAGLQRRDDSDESDDVFRLSREHEFHNLGNNYYKLGQFTKAIELYDRALELRPDLLETHFNKGLALTRLAHYPEARTCLDRTIEMNPELAECYYTRGLIYEYMMEYENAVADYDRALAADAGYTKARSQRRNAEGKLAASRQAEADPAQPRPIQEAIDLAREGLMDGAFEMLRRAEEQGMELTHGQVQDFISAIWDSGRTRQAIDGFLGLLWRRRPASRADFAWLMARVGSAYADLAEDQRLLDYTLAATAADPTDTVSFSNIADELVDDWPFAALREAETSIGLDPGRAAGYAARGAAYEQLASRAGAGQAERLRDKAIDSYRTAAQHGGPAATSAMFELAERYHEHIAPVARRQLLSDACEGFLTQTDAAEDLYVHSSFADWLYCAAHTLARLGDPRYRDFVTRARKLVFRCEGLRPYCRELDRQGSREQFLEQCDRLDELEPLPDEAAE